MSNTKSDIRELLSAIGDGIEAEELYLAGIQGLIAAEISMERQKRGISQKELAEKLNVTQALVSRWENGGVNFTLSTLVKIACALDLELQSPIVPSKNNRYSVGNVVRLHPEIEWIGSVSVTERFTGYEQKEM